MKYALALDKVNGGFPPKGGWKYRESATKWITPGPMENNFQQTLDQIISHREANPAHALSTDRQDVAQELMQQTALRILSECPEHANTWIVAMDEDAKKNSLSPSQNKQRSAASILLAGLADRASKIASRIRGVAGGAATLAEWIGEGAVPVSEDLANQRARTCSACPMNKPGDFLSEAIASAIAKQTIVKNSLSLTTDVENKLEACEACGCHLRLKVWLPIETLKKRTTDEQLAKFHPSCWIPREIGIKAPAIVSSTNTRTFTIQRKAAYGDVILATIIADKLATLGIKTRFATERIIAESLEGHPSISEFVEIKDHPNPHINLDGVYEHNLERSRKDIGLIMLEAANHDLLRYAVKIPDTVNRVPRLHIEDDERSSMAEKLRRIPKPWIVIVDGSGFWPNRQLNWVQVENLPRYIHGSCIWSKPKAFKKPPLGYFDVGLKGFRDLMALISVADLVVTPDTGPIHVAAAFNKPVVALEQCNDTRLRLTNLTDWSAVAPDLDCIRCGEFKCPIDEKKPPCQKIDAATIAEAISLKLSSYVNGKVSAVIPVYKWRDDIRNCIDAISPQVSEVLIALDGNAQPMALPYANVHWVKPTGVRTGYGKTNMRAIRGTTSEYVLLLNDDCVMEHGSVSKMLDCMKTGVGAVGCLLRYPDGSIQHAGYFRPPGAPGFGHIDYRQQSSRFKSPVEMEGVTFASALVRRKAFFDVRGFDERYDCYGEDADICMKMRQNGWRIIFTPHAEGIHNESQTTSPMKNELLHSAAKLFESKWTSVLKNTIPMH